MNTLPNSLISLPLQKDQTCISGNEAAGSKSLTGVIATALCALNKRNLQMEAAAAGIIGFKGIDTLAGR